MDALIGYLALDLYIMDHRLWHWLSSHRIDLHRTLHGFVWVARNDLDIGFAFLHHDLQCLVI